MEQAGKYLTFALGDEVYGLEILKVQEIIGIVTVTRVPKMPDFIRGVINLRGRVIPVVDLRLRFRMERRDYTERTCIIVVRVTRNSRRVTMGIIVDEVSEVLDIGEEQIEATPSFGTSVETDFILAMGKIGQNVVIMLDIDRVLSDGEIESLDPGTKKTQTEALQ